MKTKFAGCLTIFAGCLFSFYSCEKQAILPADENQSLRMTPHYNIYDSGYVGPPVHNFRHFNAKYPTPYDLHVEGITWNSATVSWSAAKEARLYNVEICDFNGDGLFLFEKTFDLSYRFTGLTPQTNYEFRVQAIFENGFGEFSAWMPFQTAGIKSSARALKEIRSDYSN